MSKPLFITFEGGEGSGKTTQIALLAERLRGLGRKVVITREPGGTALGVNIRKFLVTETADPPVATAELLLYSADRAQHVEHLIRPSLDEGSVILCDRFCDATIAYQGYGRGLELDLIKELNKVATGGLAPTRTLIMDLDPKEGVSRSMGRQMSDGIEAEARFEKEELNFHERVREGYLAIAAKEPERVKVLDANGSVEEVEIKIWAAVEELFGE